MIAIAKFRVIVNREACIGCGLAPSVCSEVFVMIDGKNAIQEKFRVDDKIDVGVIDEELFKCVKNAAENCPVDAITIEEL